MKKLCIVISMGCAFAATGVVAAGSGTINFTGKVAAQTCDVSIGGSATPAVATVTLV